MLYLPMLSRDEQYRRQCEAADVLRDERIRMLRWLTPPPQRNPKAAADYAARYQAIIREWEHSRIPQPLQNPSFAETAEVPKSDRVLTWLLLTLMMICAVIGLFYLFMR